MVLLGDAAGRLSLVSYGSREGPSKPIVRNLGVVRFGQDEPVTALELIRFPWLSRPHLLAHCHIWTMATSLLVHNAVIVRSSDCRRTKSLKAKESGKPPI